MWFAGVVPAMMVSSRHFRGYFPTKSHENNRSPRRKLCSKSRLFDPQLIHRYPYDSSMIKCQTGQWYQPERGTWRTSGVRPGSACTRWPTRFSSASSTGVKLHRVVPASALVLVDGCRSPLDTELAWTITCIKLAFPGTNFYQLFIDYYSTNTSSNHHSTMI